MSKKKYHDAISILKKIISIDKNYYDAYINLANIYDVLNNFLKAKEYLEIAISIKPSSITAFFYLANLFKKQEKYELANQFFRKAIKIQPNNPDLINNSSN